MTAAGKIDREGRALRRAWWQRDGSAVRGDDVARDAEAESGAAPDGLGRHPRLEDSSEARPAAMPVPVSRIWIRTPCAAGSAASVNVPPCGIASSALITRLSSANSNCALIRPPRAGRRLARSGCPGRRLRRRAERASRRRWSSARLRFEPAAVRASGLARSSRSRTADAIRSACSSTIRRRRCSAGSGIS